MTFRGNENEIIYLVYLSHWEKNNEFFVLNVLRTGQTEKLNANILA